MKLHLQPRSPKHREEMFKLTATLLNGVAIACLVGASFGPWLNDALQWGWQSLALIAGAAISHLMAQTVLWLGFVRGA